MSILDDYLDPDRHLWPAEPPEAYQTVLDFFCAENEDEAKRNLYKSTDCGAWIEFTEQGIKLGSIVEGCDFGTAIYPLNYADEFTSADIQARIDAIEKEADATWQWANVLKDITGRRNCNGKTDAERGLDPPDVDFEFQHINPDVMSTPSQVEAMKCATTWGEWGNIYRSIAERSDQGKALKHLAPDLARALASCQALNAIRGTLTPKQQETVARVLADELLKQGF